MRGSCKFGSRTLAIVINDVLASILTSYFQRCFIIITTILTLTLCSFKKNYFFEESAAKVRFGDVLLSIGL